MTRLIVTLNGADSSYINISADRIERDADAILAYNGDALVGYFDTGCVLEAHLSSKEDAHG